MPHLVAAAAARMAFAMPAELPKGLVPNDRRRLAHVFAAEADEPAPEPTCSPPRACTARLASETTCSLILRLEKSRQPWMA